MYTTYDFQKVNEEFGEKLFNRKQKLKKIWGTLLGITVFIIVLFIVIFPNQFSKGETAWILPTYGGMLLVTTLIGFLVSIGFVSEKPFFTTLFPMIYEKINQTESLFLEYESYPKEKATYNHEGGLFTRYATVKTRRTVKGKTEDEHDFVIHDCTMTTSNGKSQQVHFDGNYFILKKPINTNVQIRQNGSPKFKGIKYIKQETQSELKVFKKENDNLNNVDYILIQYVEKLLEQENVKRAYLSAVDNEIHLGLWYRQHPSRKNKNFTLEVLNAYYQYFLSELELLNDLEQQDNYGGSY